MKDTIRYRYVVMDKETGEVIAEGTCKEVADRLCITQKDLKSKIGKKYKYKCYWSNFVVGRYRV